MIALIHSFGSVVAFSASRSFERTRKPSLSSRLDYASSREATSAGIEVADLDAAVQERRAAVRKWWTPFFPSSAVERPVEEDTEDSKQAVVDDYLEFLDRRYHMLHDDDDQGEVKFSAFKWLKQGEEAAEPMTQEQHDDALYVLGVAGLASQRLLQRKHQAVASEVAPVPSATKIKQATDAEVVKDDSSAPVAKMPAEGALPVAAAIVLARITPVLRGIALRRKLFLRYQTRKITAALVVLAKTATTGSIKALKSAWRMSGGRKNVAVTASIMAVIAFQLLRPVAQTIVSEITA